MNSHLNQWKVYKMKLYPGYRFIPVTKVGLLMQSVRKKAAGTPAAFKIIDC
jgi:hypothetical protein